LSSFHRVAHYHSTELQMDDKTIENFRHWLTANKRAGYLPALTAIVQEPDHTLSWCDAEDLVAIFSTLKESDDPNFYSVDELSSLLSDLSFQKQ